MRPSFSVRQDRGTTTPQLDPKTRDVNVGSQQLLDFEAHRQKRRTPRYWPTTRLTGEQMVGALRVAKMQDEAVLAIFRCSGSALSPSQVWQTGIDHGRRWLLTSVRRSITNLTDDGVLQHLHSQRPGPYGKPEGLWRLVDPKAVAA